MTIQLTRKVTRTETVDVEIQAPAYFKHYITDTMVKVCEDGKLISVNTGNNYESICIHELRFWDSECYTISINAEEFAAAFQEAKSKIDSIQL